MPEEPPAPRPRRRGRTALLLATAAVLGLVAGTCTGYLIQADRKPTALPPLSQPTLTQAKGKGPEPLSAAQDRRVKMNGDLRKLLLTRPKGAKAGLFPVADDGWLDLAGYADQYERPGTTFTNLAADEFRRAAATTWLEGEDHNVEIYLVQFVQESKPAASEWTENGYYWAEDEGDTRSWPLPGTGDGMVYVHDSPDREPGYFPLYRAEAHAWRGDVSMEIWITDTKPIPKAKIMDLAERQMGKL
ncbi:hypothetical protein ABT124_15315 [Streptomyces sp. NPDC001982]|uniref:hypothetical protein n=1 Tax=unclassified Streptomyces TaxID=2593676 RepID=UPI00331C3682